MDYFDAIIIGSGQGGTPEAPSSSRSRWRSTARIRCYLRDPDGYPIEVGQSTDVKYG